MNRRPYRMASTRFYLLEALRAIGRVEDREGLDVRHRLARDNILAALEKLESTKKRAKKTRVGADVDPLLHVVRRARADLAAASVLRKPPGPIITRATTELLALERAGRITPAESSTAFERIIAHYAFTHDEVKGMSNHTDLPAELAAYSDGPSDDGSFHPELIGCGMPGVGRTHLSVAGSLGDLAVGGLPGYLFTRRNLANPVVRRRLAATIKAMTPKVRRRVLRRLKTAATLASRVSGAVRNAYPTVAGGWSGVTIAGGCPYANVAGPLTP